MRNKVRVILDCDLITNHNEKGYAIVKFKESYAVIDEYGKVRIDFETHQFIQETEDPDVFLRSYYGAEGMKHVIK